MSRYDSAPARHAAASAADDGGKQGYCAMVVAPKVDKFMRTFADLVRSDA